MTSVSSGQTFGVVSSGVTASGGVIDHQVVALGGTTVGTIISGGYQFVSGTASGTILSGSDKTYSSSVQDVFVPGDQLPRLQQLLERRAAASGERRGLSK